jgi:hypothetical protein
MLWKGKPIEQLSKEELLAALRELGEMYYAHNEQHRRSFQLLKDLYSARSS